MIVTYSLFMALAKTIFVITKKKKKTRIFFEASATVKFCILNNPVSNIAHFYSVCTFPMRYTTQTRICEIYMHYIENVLMHNI